MGGHWACDQCREMLTSLPTPFAHCLSASLLPDVDVPSPDEKSVITYVSSIYDAFPKVPEGGEGISAIVSTAAGWDSRLGGSWGSWEGFGKGSVPCGRGLRRGKRLRGRKERPPYGVCPVTCWVSVRPRRYPGSAGKKLSFQRASRRILLLSSFLFLGWHHSREALAHDPPHSFSSLCALPYPHGDLPTSKDALAPQEVDSRWLEYQTRVESLISWIKQHTILMSDKSFPQNPVELKVGPGQGPPAASPVPSAEGWVVAFPRVVPDQPFLWQALYNQYIHFKETEIPAKEQEKGQIEELYKLLEVRIATPARRLVGGNVVLFQQD